MEELTQAGELECVTPASEIPVPKRGTRDWILAQPLVEYDGTLVPASNRIPQDATLLKTEDDGFCQVVFPDGRRCRATRIRGLLLCSGHSGGGDPEAGVIAARAQRTRIKERRILLGISANRVGDPRNHARMRALERAEALAAALVDGPLDDDRLGSMERQTAAVRALDSTFPIQSMSVEVEIPATAEAVSEMSWEAMQSLAARLLVDDPGELEEA